MTQKRCQLGVVMDPIEEITRRAHAHGAVVVVDGAQGIVHTPVDVQHMGADFYAFSSHKIYGPTGVGVLYGRRELLESMPPYQGGGDMIRSVSFEGTTYNDVPYKFEAGTPNIAGTVGLGAALEYLEALGVASTHAYVNELHAELVRALESIDGIRFIGTARERVRGSLTVCAGTARPPGHCRVFRLLSKTTFT